MLTLESDGMDHVREKLDALPPAREGFLDIVSIIPVGPYTSYGRLFRPESEDRASRPPA